MAPAAALCLLLLRPSAAQDVELSAPMELSASSVAAVAQSTVTPARLPAHARRPIFVTIHKEASRWKPFSVRAGGNPAKIKNAVASAVRKVKVKGKMVRKGDSSKAVAVARLHKVKGDLMLVVCVYPESLKRARRHLEARYWIVEGFLEGVQLAAVSISRGAASPEDLKEDSLTLTRKGRDFDEVLPSGAGLRVAALDARPRKASENAASIEAAEFGGRLGSVDFGYSVRGVAEQP